MAERKEKLVDRSRKNNRVLLVYYSFSGQTGVLINRLAAGLKEQGIEVFFEKLCWRHPAGFFLFNKLNIKNAYNY